MFKLTIIGAAIATSVLAETFLDKFAMKQNLQSVANPAYVAPFVDDLLNCYDVNGDGHLSRAELQTMVTGHVSNTDCPTQGTPILQASDINLLQAWIGGTPQLNKIYSAVNGRINKASWVQAVQGKSNLVIVGKTASGQEFGGYTGSAVIPTTSTSGWLTATNMFMFSLNLATKYVSNYNSLNIWVNTIAAYDDMIDFGYANALQFESRASTNAQVKYTYNSDFYSAPAATSIVGSALYTSLVAFDVYQVSF